MKNQISFLEKCLNDLSKKEGAVIGISWPETRTELHSVSGGMSWSTNSWTENHVEVFPTDLQEQIKELIQDKLDELKQKFELL